MRVIVAKCLAIIIRSNPRNVALPRAFTAFPVIAPGPGIVLEDEPDVVYSVEGEEDRREILDDHECERISVGTAILVV